MNQQDPMCGERQGFHILNCRRRDWKKTRPTAAEMLINLDAEEVLVEEVLYCGGKKIKLLNFDCSAALIQAFNSSNDPEICSFPEEATASQTE